MHHDSVGPDKLFAALIAGENAHSLAGERECGGAERRHEMIFATVMAPGCGGTGAAAQGINIPVKSL